MFKKNAVLNEVEPIVVFTPPPAGWLPSLLVSDKVMGVNPTAPQLLVIRTDVDAAKIKNIDTSISIKKIQSQSCGQPYELKDVPAGELTPGVYLLTKQ